MLTGTCIETYVNSSSSTVQGSYKLSINSSSMMIGRSEYTDAACQSPSGDTAWYSNGACIQSGGGSSYFSVSVNASESSPALLPGMYYIGYQTLSDCENEVSQPASYQVKFPAGQCTPATGIYYLGSCQADGSLSYSVYDNPSCSGTSVTNGSIPLPGVPNHGCTSRLMDDYDSSDSASNWLRFYCGTHQAFSGMTSPTQRPALVPSSEPTRAIVRQFSGYLQQEFFTDSGCVHPYKTIFTASGQCSSHLASNSLYNQANYSEIVQFTISGNQVFRDVAYYSDLSCQALAYRYTASTTSTSCSPYPYWSDGLDARRDLYVVQSFVTGTATPSVPQVGIITNRYSDRVMNVCMYVCMCCMCCRGTIND